MSEIFHEHDTPEMIIFDAFASDVSLSIGVDGALEVGGMGTLSAELCDRIERNAAQLVEYLASLPWRLGYDPESLAEREAARRSRPYFQALERWVSSTGATSDWLDSLQTVRLENGRTLGDGRNGGIRRAITRMLDDRASHREAARMLAEAMELIPAAENRPAPAQRPVFAIPRSADPHNPATIAERWRDDGTLDALPDRLAVSDVAEWRNPAQGIRASLDVLRHSPHQRQVDEAHACLAEIVPDVARWLANGEQQKGEAA